MRAALSATAPESLQVLQCGYSKSGNYLLHRILASILDRHGCFRSFVEASGVGAAIDALCPDTKRMPDARRVDNFKLVEGRWHVQFPDLRCRFLPLDFELALAHSTLVWSHDRPDHLAKWEDRFSHRIYVLRDGRDVVNSMLHYLVTPAILALYPDHRFGTLDEIYADLDFFAGKVEAWRDHARALQIRAGRWYVVRFESLVEHREEEVAALAAHLGLPLDAAPIAASTDFARMRASAPRHLREGRRGDWQQHFGSRHREIFKEIAGPELIDLGYADSLDW